MVRLKSISRQETFGRNEHQHVAQFIATGIPRPRIELSWLLRWRDPSAFVRHHLAHSNGESPDLFKGPRSPRSSNLGSVQIVHAMPARLISETTAYTKHTQDRRFDRNNRFEEGSPNVGWSAQRVGKLQIWEESQRRVEPPRSRRFWHGPSKLLGAQSFELRASSVQERAFASPRITRQSLHLRRSHPLGSLRLDQRNFLQILRAQSKTFVNKPEPPSAVCRTRLSPTTFADSAASLAGHAARAHDTA